MALDQKDVLTRLKEARAQAQSSSSPFFFLKAGEKALVRVLRDYDEMTAIRSHRKYDETQRKYIHHVCAQEYGHQCQTCLDAKDDWKLKPQDFFYLPVYVHKKINATGETREVEQQLLFEMPSFDGILAGLGAIFFAEDNVKGDITTSDLVISRIGEGNKSKYTVVARKGQPLALPPDCSIPDDEMIRSDVELAHPMQAIEKEETSPPATVAVGKDPFTSSDDEFYPF